LLCFIEAQSFIEIAKAHQATRRESEERRI